MIAVRAEARAAAIAAAPEAPAVRVARAAIAAKRVLNSRKK